MEQKQTNEPEKDKEYWKAHPEEYWKKYPERKILSDKMKEIYQAVTDKMKFTAEAIRWAREKHLITEAHGFGPEVQRHAVTMYLLELAHQELHKTE